MRKETPLAMIRAIVARKYVATRLLRVKRFQSFRSIWNHPFVAVASSTVQAADADWSAREHHLGLCGESPCRAL